MNTTCFKKFTFSFFIYSLLFIFFLVFLNGCKNPESDSDLNLYKKNIENLLQRANEISDSLNREESLKKWPFYSDTCIWIDEILSKGNIPNGENVIIKGKFNCDDERGYGHFNLWKGEITDITQVRKYPSDQIKKNNYLTVLDLMANPSEYNGKIVTVAGFLSLFFESRNLYPLRK
ncbi:MAG: hypothetical protein FJ216_11255 [Ignavibacteria bacterium]|nr:hypothetical protein [Ignavibacteria bacterium]